MRDARISLQMTFVAARGRRRIEGQNNMETSIDYAAIKARQQGAWSTGDYAVVGTTLQIVGELLCEALDLRSGSRVLDVAAGNGNATLAAARRWCDVTSTDYVPTLLESGRKRAAGRGPLHQVPGGGRRESAVRRTVRSTS